MRGYFAIGAENISKPMNLGNLIRSAHAFGASFFFTIAPVFAAGEVRLSDTSDAAKHLPLYNYDSVDELALPRGCALPASGQNSGKVFAQRGHRGRHRHVRPPDQPRPFCGAAAQSAGPARGPARARARRPGVP